MREGFVLSVLVVVFFFFQLASSTVVLEPYSISFPDLPAKSAPGLKRSGMCGALHVADPPDACFPLLKPKNGTAEQVINFVLIIRGQCSFDDKIRNAQSAGFRAAIVYDDRVDTNLVYMMMDPEGVKVHAVFVANAAGEVLRTFARSGPGKCCIYPSHVDKSWTVLAISLISLAVVLACLIVALFAPRHWVNRFRGMQSGFYVRNVDARAVGALPSIVFWSSRGGTRGETCAICLEDYKDGEVLRLLPCQHVFHLSCVDLWLTKWGTCCPVCKFDLRTNTSVLENKRGLQLQNQQRS